MKTNFTFREITEKDELEACFRLRYEVYSNCEVKSCIKENEDYVEIDYYDVHARHFALYQANYLVGYFRVVLPKDELTNKDVLEIGKKYKLLDETEYFHKNGKAPFPFLSYKGVPQGHWDYYYDLLTRNEKLAEASRLILHTQFRSISTSKFLIECAMSLLVCICIGHKHAFVNCSRDHCGFYAHYGFSTIANGTSFICGINRTVLTLTVPLAQSLSTSTIPKQHHTKLQSMARNL